MENIFDPKYYDSDISKELAARLMGEKSRENFVSRMDFEGIHCYAYVTASSKKHLEVNMLYKDNCVGFVVDNSYFDSVEVIATVAIGSSIVVKTYNKVTTNVPVINMPFGGILDTVNTVGTSCDGFLGYLGDSKLSLVYNSGNMNIVYNGARHSNVQGLLVIGDWVYELRKKDLRKSKDEGKYSVYYVNNNKIRNSIKEYFNIHDDCEIKIALYYRKIKLFAERNNSNHMLMEYEYVDTK